MADPGTGALAPPLAVVAPTGPPEGELADALALLLLAAGRGQDDQLAPPGVWRQLVLASLPAAGSEYSEYSWPGLRWVRPASGGPDRDGQVAGVSLALPSAQLPRARGQDSARLAGLLDREGRRGLLTALREQEGAVPPAPADGLYLSRLAVAPRARGQGVGAALVVDLLQRARAAGGPAYLHVAADNAVARRLYARHGFVDRAEGRAAGGVRLVLMSTG